MAPKWTFLLKSQTSTDLERENRSWMVGQQLDRGPSSRHCVNALRGKLDTAMQGGDRFYHRWLVESFTTTKKSGCIQRLVFISPTTTFSVSFWTAFSFNLHVFFNQWCITHMVLYYKMQLVKACTTETWHCLRSTVEKDYLRSFKVDRTTSSQHFPWHNLRGRLGVNNQIYVTVSQLSVFPW